MSDKIEPALTPEQWAAFEEAGGMEEAALYIHHLRAVQGHVPGIESVPSRRAVAAAALAGPEPHFTWEDVDMLEGIMDTDDFAVYRTREHAEQIQYLAARIAALLPPRKEES